MTRRHDLASLAWRLAGFTPNMWRSALSEPWMCESGLAEVAAVPARLPGSVHQALLEAGVIAAWDRGMGSLASEWTENRHWVFEADLPDAWFEAASAVRLACEGADYAGWVYLGDTLVSDFVGGHTPLDLDLTPALRPSGNRLRLIFGCPPRYLGFTGDTSRFTDWKPRFCYSWDWMVRVVTAGVWGAVTLEVTREGGLAGLRVRADADPGSGTGSLRVSGAAVGGAAAGVSIRLLRGGNAVWSAQASVGELAAGLEADDLAVDLWWPNGLGAQPLYEVECTLHDEAGRPLDAMCRRVGFRRIEWRPCEGAPVEADPWVCTVNGRPFFVQGVNWTPIRPNFHDVGDQDYRLRLAGYRDMGVNTLRVWGGGILEKSVFYDLCDEMGILVWQEFPLSSSTFENVPPDGPGAVAAMVRIAEANVARRGHHASLAMWCGGNELAAQGPAGTTRERIPLDCTHPMLAALGRAIAELDPGRRFVPTSPSGPRFFGSPQDFGKGLHWDVHGPWVPEGGLDGWQDYWARDDAMLRSEVGCPGASPAAILREYCAPDAFAARTPDGPRFRRPFDQWWWMEVPRFTAEHGRGPATLEEFVEWSQRRQAEALQIAVRACKERFPRCGGIVLWMGHDSFPCSSNTSIFDYHGRPKPAVSAVARVFTDREDQ